MLCYIIRNKIDYSKNTYDELATIITLEMSSVEQDMLNAALSYYRTDSQARELELETLRDKALFWETRCKALEKRLEEINQESEKKDTRIEYLERLLKAIQDERDNLYSFKNKILSLNSSTDTEEQLLKAKIEIATLRERSDDYEVFIHELNNSLKVIYTQQKNQEIHNLRQELSQSASSNVSAIEAPNWESEFQPERSQKISKLRSIFRSKKSKSHNKGKATPSSFWK